MTELADTFLKNNNNSRAPYFEEKSRVTPSSVHQDSVFSTTLTIQHPNHEETDVDTLCDLSMTYKEQDHSEEAHFYANIIFQNAQNSEDKQDIIEKFDNAIEKIAKELGRENIVDAPHVFNDTDLIYSFHDTDLIIPVTALYNSGGMTDIQYDEAMRLVNELENIANEPKTPHEAVAPQHDHDTLTA